MASPVFSNHVTQFISTRVQKTEREYLLKPALYQPVCDVINRNCDSSVMTHHNRDNSDLPILMPNSFTTATLKINVVQLINKFAKHKFDTGFTGSYVGMSDCWGLNVGF